MTDLSDAAVERLAAHLDYNDMPISATTIRALAAERATRRAEAQRLREAMSDILNNTEAPNGRDETARFDLDAIWVRARAALAATTKDASDAE